MLERGTLFVHCLFVIFVVIAGRATLAGATASQWVVVVNGDSVRSRTIANHFVQLRNVPSRNVIVLKNVPAMNTIHLKEFRELILLPLVQEIEKRQLTSHIQGIAYSSDFPTAVNLSEELQPQSDRSPYLTPVASINGLTYLFRFVLDSHHDRYLAFTNNFYCQRPAPLLFEVPLDGEKSLGVWKQIKQAQSENRLADAGEFIDRLVDDYPHQYPLYYLAAQAYAKAGQSDKALQRLEKAVNGGWCYAEHLHNDAAFTTLLSSRKFQTLRNSCEDLSFDWTPILGFDARKFYSPNSVSSNDAKLGVSYLLSVCLAVCSPNGNTEAEAVSQLQRSVLADYSHPEGTFYFTQTDDVRTKCRQDGFEAAVNKLKSLGFEGRITSQTMPIRKEKILGLTMGEASFSWSHAKSDFVPGAIADNLTSFGGAMEESSQTKLTEFLRHGAAGASGTVTEPYSLQAKFPLPMVHASYASGLTLAEAFYASIAGPYQLLIVGDPLCQPFATPPRFRIDGIQDRHLLENQTKIDMKRGDAPNSVSPKNVSFFVDGQFKGSLDFPSSITYSNSNMMAGAHELRFMGIAPTRIEERWETSFQLWISQDSKQLLLSAPAQVDSASTHTISLSVDRNELEGDVNVYHDYDLVHTIDASKSECEVPIERVGRGPVRLHAVLKSNSEEIASLPFTVTVE